MTDRCTNSPVARGTSALATALGAAFDEFIVRTLDAKLSVADELPYRSTKQELAATGLRVWRPNHGCCFAQFRSMLRVWLHRFAFLLEAIDLSPNARHIASVPHCRPQETLSIRTGRASPECTLSQLRIKRIDTETVTSAQFDPGRGHDLHQPERSSRRYGMRITATFDLHHGIDPTLRDPELVGGFGQTGRMKRYEAGLWSAQLVPAMRPPLWLSRAVLTSAESPKWPHIAFGGQPPSINVSPSPP
ncbi:hypothetical protein ABIB00_006336 [Bradyrhizobium sp. LB14.3]